MILILLASHSVGMIYMRSNLDDNLTWVLSVHIWHSDGARNEKYWFGLHRGCVTSTWPKLKCTPQNFPACKISGHFIHWGPFYGTPCPRIWTLLPPPFSHISNHFPTSLVVSNKPQSALLISSENWSHIAWCTVSRRQNLESLHTHCTAAALEDTNLEIFFTEYLLYMCGTLFWGSKSHSKVWHILVFKEYGWTSWPIGSK